MMLWIPKSRVELRWGDFFECETDWSWSVRGLPHLDLWYITRGVGWIAGYRTRTPIRAGDCLLLRRGGSYQAGHDPDRPLSLIAVYFDLLDQRGRLLDSPDEKLPAFRRRMNDGSFFRLLLTRAITAHKEGCREWASSWLQAALMEVIRQDVRTWPAGALGEQGRTIERLCEQIRRHPARPVRVTDMAAELNVTPKHFGRIFVRFQGMSPRAFITQTRIDAAQMLLLKSSHSISRVAELVGYDSPYYFSRQFKNKVGLSPRAFRRGERKQ